MKLGFYPRLALKGIQKNRRMYLPYILTCIGMVLMVYIMNYLIFSDAIAAVRGGRTIQYIMNTGIYIIIFFAALFLFYTNAFLLRRRKKEFGLYNILGMGKLNLTRILVWESIFVAAISLAVGLAGGISLSKMAELGLVNILGGSVTYTLSISGAGVLNTVKPFLVIFLLLLLNSVRQIWRSSSIALLRSESTGEKPPKSNIILGALGAVILGAAYYMALAIQDPITAILTFVADVIMVIAATYLLMIAGSVLFCRILQKNKRYYYKPNHFVSVASMVYRMKRNGAGLASICILATMVLVMISSTSALFIGGESVLRNRYPRELDIWIRMYENRDMTDEDMTMFRNAIDGVLEKHGAVPENVAAYHSVNTSGFLDSDGTVIVDQSTFNDLDLNTFADVHQIYLIPVEDYNYMMGTDVALAEDEVLIYAPRNTFRGDSFGFAGLRNYRVREILKDCFISPDVAMDIVPALVVIVPDVSAAAQGLVSADGVDLTYRKWYYCFDTSVEDAEDIALHDALKEAFRDLQLNGHDTFNYSVESREDEKNDFYSLYGGLFYLGISLSIVFLFATVLIIYYKQVSEGYEDQARFEIMQKVGMTKRDIRKSINSQLLTVFFLPLAGAGLHLAFAFPIIERLLLLFNLNNHTLFVCTTAGSFLIFTVLYCLMYRLTSNAYYQIVSGAKDRE